MAGAVLLTRSEGSLLNRLALSNHTAVKIGLISHPPYLWHWPLLVFAELIKFDKPLTDLERSLVIGLAFFSAWLTYKLVERPIRFGRGIKFVKPLAAWMAAIAVAAFAPAAGYGPTIPDRISKLVAIPDPLGGLRVGGVCLRMALSSILRRAAPIKSARLSLCGVIQLHRHSSTAFVIRKRHGTLVSPNSR